MVHKIHGIHSIVNEQGLLLTYEQLVSAIITRYGVDMVGILVIQIQVEVLDTI